MTSTADSKAILKRLKRKARVLHLDLIRENDVRYHDMQEMLILLDMLAGAGDEPRSEMSGVTTDKSVACPAPPPDADTDTAP